MPRQSGGPMAGPNPLEDEALGFQADYKGPTDLKPCLIGVSSHPLMWFLIKTGTASVPVFVLYHLHISGKSLPNYLIHYDTGSNRDIQALNVAEHRN